MLPCPEKFASGRLILRRWCQEDFAPYAAMCADPNVMRYFPSLRTVEESTVEARSHDASFDTEGFGLWALEIPGEARFIGYTGLRRILRPMPFTPSIEIGWRLGSAWWGQGYATEAARAALRDFFERTEHPEIVSFTSRPNVPSQRVMERLGMVRDLDGDFDHPALTEGHPLRPHVLYRLSREQFEKAAMTGRTE